MTHNSNNILVSAQEIYQHTFLKRLGFIGKFLAWLLLKITKLDQLNKRYAKISHLDYKDFLAYITKHELAFQYQLPPEDLARIPTSGAFIIVANHPLGSLDGILMLHLISAIRPDFKVMGNFLLKKFKPLQEHIIAVNPFENNNATSSMAGMRETLTYLKQGGCVGIFPAGEVSRYYNSKVIADRPWQESALRLIRRTNVPVVPMYFQAQNSKLFYWLAKIHPSLATLKLPSEMLNKKSSQIRIRIGKAITLEKQDKYLSLSEYTDYLRNKMDVLASYCGEQGAAVKRKKNFRKKSSRHSAPNTPAEPIIAAIASELLQQEITQLRAVDNSLLFCKNDKYECFFASAAQIPNILQEIGRLREITFRAIGEGSNKAADLDRYDQHYKHLFLWDKVSHKIIGSYRMAIGSEIYPQYGIDGFYIKDSFDFQPDLIPIFQNVIEMGRAFVTLEYQKLPLPLFLLWQGIIHIIINNPQVKYLIGSVSISNSFSNLSKSLIVEYLNTYYVNHRMAKKITAKNPFKGRLSKLEKKFLFEFSKLDLNMLDQLIDEIEPSYLRFPVLLKKYIKQNGKLISFNVDPDFNNSLDGLIYIRVAKIPASTFKPVLKELAGQKIE